MSSLSLFQEIFLTQGLNPDLLHRRQILYCLSHQGSPANTTTQKTSRILNQFELVVLSGGQFCHTGNI